MNIPISVIKPRSMDKRTSYFFLAFTIALIEIGGVHTVTSKNRYVRKASYNPDTTKPGPFEILFQVRRDENSKDKPFMIDCEAKSDLGQHIKYRWTKNGNEFNWTHYSGRISLLNGTLMFHEPRDEDAGQYQCFAETDDGVVTSNSVFVRKKTLTRFPINIRNITVYEGTQLNISCGYSSIGYPKPTFYWTKKSIGHSYLIGKINTTTTVTVDPNGTLWFFNVKYSDVGYQTMSYIECCAENGMDTSCGNVVSLTLIPRHYTTESKSEIKFANANGTKVEVEKEHSVDLWCIATGIPIPIMKWKRKDGFLPKGVEYKNNKRTLTIKNVNLDDEGTYVCEAKNKWESKDHFINLTVFMKPILILEPRPKFNSINNKGENTFKLQCSAEGWPKPEIKWIYNGNPFEGTSVNPDSLNHKMRIHSNIIVTNDGHYGCNASNVYGYMYKEALLKSQNILTNDLINLREHSLVNKTDVVGTSVILICDEQYHSVLRRGNVKLWEGQPSTLNAGYVIMKLNHSDAGEYFCQIRHPHATVNKTILLTVIENIKFEIKPEDQDVNPGQMVTFQCAVIAESDYNLKISWVRDNLFEINYATQNRFSSHNETHALPILTTEDSRWKVLVNSTLTIKNVTESDSGSYFCTVKNKTTNDFIIMEATLTVLTINTWNCNKKRKHSDCLKNLQSILNSSDADLNATIVIKTLEGLNGGSNLDSNASTYAGYEILSKANLAHKVTLKTEIHATNSDWEKIANKTLNVFGNLLTNQSHWTGMNKSEKSHVFTKFLYVMDSTSLDLAEKRTKDDKDSKLFQFKKNNSIDSIVTVLGLSESNNGTVIYADDKAFPYKNSISVKTQNSSKLNYAFTTIQTSYIEIIVDSALKSSENGTNNANQLNGKMISFKSSVKLIKPKVRIEFAHNVKAVYNPNKVFKRKLCPGEKRKAILGNSTCAFWNTKAKVWSKEGCNTTKSDKFVTICECNHLTAFTILTGFHEYSGNDPGLQILTWILCPLSIICLSLALAAFLLDKQGRSDKTKINIHLCLSLICGNVFLLLGDKNYFPVSVTSDVICTVFGVLTHLTWLCAFGWMAVEGIHLYIQVVKVFAPSTIHLFKIYYGIGYGIPLLVVAITFSIGFAIEDDNIYVGEVSCFLTGNYIWGFVAPAFLIGASNLCILVKAISIASNRHQTKIAKAAANTKSESDRKKKYYRMEKLIRGSLSLTFILGITWLFGFFALIDFQGQIIFAYVFTILNASQGIFIFIFHYEQIRQVTTRLMEQTTFISFSKSTEMADYSKSKSTSEAVKEENSKLHPSTNEESKLISPN